MLPLHLTHQLLSLGFLDLSAPPHASFCRWLLISLSLSRFAISARYKGARTRGQGLLKSTAPLCTNLAVGMNDCVCPILSLQRPFLIPKAYYQATPVIYSNSLT